MEKMKRPSLEKLFNPKSIAVVGASERPDAVGTRVIANLGKMGYTGQIFPVNPKYSELDGRPCFPSLRSLPQQVDAVFLGVPAAAGPDLLEEAGQCGIRAAFVNANGYADGDSEGQERQVKLEQVANRYGIALCGPNNIGLINVHDRTAVWTPRYMKILDEGSVGVISQSGSIALILSEDERDLGFAYLVTTGNEPVVDVADYLSFMTNDDRVSTVLLFLETIRNPAMFADAAKQARQRGKRIVALKLGTSDRGRALVQAHTGSLAGEDRLYDAFFKDLGIVRVADLDEMLETATVLSRYPEPAPADGTVILTLSGGEAALIADLSDQVGMTLPALNAETHARLRPAFPPYSTIGNPVDAWGLGFNADRFKNLIDALLSDETIGTIALSVDAPGRGGGDVPYACTMARICAEAKTKKHFVFFNNTAGTGVNADVLAILNTANIPYLSGMRTALAALKNVARAPVRAESAAKPPEINALPTSDADRFALLRSHGVPMVRVDVVKNVDQATTAARALGYPIALKGVADHLPHKSDLGLVHLGLTNDKDIKRAFEAVTGILALHTNEDSLAEIVVQPMAPEGIELILGVRNLPGFGSFIIVGPGGVLVEITNKASIRVGPVSEEEAVEMLRETVAGKLLSGVRGKGPWDLAAAAKAISAFSVFGASCAGTLAALEINPLIIGAKNAFGVDVLFETHNHQ